VAPRSALQISSNPRSPSTRLYLAGFHLFLILLFHVEVSALVMLLFGVKIAAVMTAIGMNLSPLDDIAQFRREGHTGEKHPLPYMMIAVNCLTWCFYAVLKGDYFPMLMTNGIGAAAGMFHISAFVYFQTYNTETAKSGATPQSAKKEGEGSKYDGRPYLAVVFLSIFLWASIIVSHDEKEAASILGTCGILVVCGLFGSPLIVMADVIKSKNSRALSRPLSFLSFLCALSWTTYGFLAQDIFIWGPNSVGLMLATAQLSLILIYPDLEGEDSSASTKTSGIESVPVVGHVLQLLTKILTLKGSKRDPRATHDGSPSTSISKVEIELQRRYPKKEPEEGNPDLCLDNMLLNDHSAIGYAS